MEASRLGLRPILMTSIGFIAGVSPLVISRGAGAEMRQAMGVAVFSGMIGVTLFGLFLTPVFYVALMKLGRHKAVAPASQSHGPALSSAGAATGVAAVALLLMAGSLSGGPFTVGPDYQRPRDTPPGAYKTAQLRELKQGRPLDPVPQGSTWETFRYPTLNEFEQQTSA